jgi:hypothetical protein
MAECGCKIIYEGSGVVEALRAQTIAFCPKHEAAGDTARERDEAWEKYAVAANALADCKAALEELQRLAWGDVSGHSIETYEEAKANARKAITAARGGVAADLLDITEAERADAEMRTEGARDTLPRGGAA